MLKELIPDFTATVALLGSLYVGVGTSANLLIGVGALVIYMRTCQKLSIR